MNPATGKRWHTREDSGLRLDKRGRWWHDDEPISHPKIVEAFNRGLSPTEDGRYVLHFGNDWAYVQVEDAAYQVVAVDFLDSDIFVRLSDRTAEQLYPETLRWDGEGVLRCRVKRGKAWARFTRDAQFQLGSLLESSDDRLVLRLGNHRWTISGN